MILIAGLGNPGSDYAFTRHNFGFMAADALVASEKVQFALQNKWKSEVAELPHANHGKAFVIKPTTFMNLSGEAVAVMAQFYKIEPKNIWIIADDLDLPLGKIRVRHGGESGGHNGLKSIATSLGSDDFWRIRLGVRGDALRAEHIENAIAARDFVTRPFEAREKSFVDKTIAETVVILREALSNGELRAHTWSINGYDEAAATLT